MQCFSDLEILLCFQRKDEEHHIAEQEKKKAEQVILECFGGAWGRGGQSEDFAQHADTSKANPRGLNTFGENLHWEKITLVTCICNWGNFA